MNSIRDTIWNKRVHPSVSLMLLVFSVLSIIWMSKNIITSGIKASGSSVPENVQISNVTDSSFSVSYTTSEAVIGSVNYGNDGQVGSLALDVRDQQSGAPTAYTIHYFTISHLSPSSTYYFSIDSSGQTYLNNGSFYTVATASTLTQAATNTFTVKGTVVNDGGGSPVEGIVLLSSSTSQVLSALLMPNGSYTIPLGTIRSQSLATYATLSPDTVLNETVEDQSNISHVLLLAGQANPVPLITLSKDYDFSINSAAVAAQAILPTGAQLTGFPSNVNTITVSSPIVMIPTSNQTFNDQQPQFSGKALPNTQVSITVQSTQEQSATISTDQYGNWTYRPSIPLTPGQHTITVQTPNSSGVMQTIARMFTVYAQGSQFTAPSGPPAVLTVTPPLPSVTPVPTATPTPAPSPTVLPTPSQIPTSSVVPTVATPVTGSSIVVFGTIGMGIIAGIGGLLFFFL